MVGTILLTQIVADHVDNNRCTECDLVAIHRTPQVERYDIAKNQYYKHLAVVRNDSVDDVVQFFLEFRQISRWPLVRCSEV